MSARSQGPSASPPGTPDRPSGGESAGPAPLLAKVARPGAAPGGRAVLVGWGADGAAPAWTEREAAALWQAERAAEPIETLALRHPGLDLADAYRIQSAGLAHRIAAGARPIGHKVGLTSEAMRRQMGIDEPDSGVLLDYMAVPHGATSQWPT
ncbi:hypothetical protein ACIGZJ_31945 [Kitasatospora sp. NPDC052868]|uniref:hypothetical protein n=1 Tax=Kitasatospora sp. NPDC052868 TaxID=3364060 RepID=UPI0037CC75B3